MNIPLDPAQRPEAETRPHELRQLAVYVHWPFCRSKCPYCDFNSHVRDGVAEDRFLRAYRAELDGFAAQTAGRAVASVFFGGGTPSLMQPGTVAALLEHIRQRWPTAPDVEVTLEANPSTLETGRLRAFREVGVNRLSLGVQALDDQALRFLGRGHSAADARAAVALAGETFARFSFDLMWGWPGHDAPSWRRQLAEACRMAGEHLSVYQLTIEAGTAFAREGVRGVDEDGACDLHAATQEVLDAAGLPAYEISNHARPGGECRHNLLVWDGADYLGIGPGAHGRLQIEGASVATRGLNSPEKWLARAEATGSGIAERVVLTPAERREELLLSGLRLVRGIDRRRFRELAAMQPEDAVDATALSRLIDAGFIESDAQGLRATKAGLLRLNAVLGYLIAG